MQCYLWTDKSDGRDYQTEIEKIKINIPKIV